MNSFISIIVAARDRSETIEKCLNSLRNINYPKDGYEIIVVNDGSTDGTAEKLKYYKDIKVIETKGVGPGQARNIASEQAAGDFVAFTDADCIVDREWLHHLLSGFQTSKVAGVGGNQESPDDETPLGRSVMSFFKLSGFLGGYVKSSRMQQISSVEHNPACNVMYRKGIFLDVGGFQHGLWPGEDVDLDHRLRTRGYFVNYSPQARVYHYQPKDVRKFVSKIYSYGKWSGGYLTRKYGMFRKMSFVPVACVLILVIWISLFLQHYWLGIAFIVLGLLVGFLLIFQKQGDLRESSRVFLLLIISIFIWNIGYLSGLTIKNVR